MDYGFVYVLGNSYMPSVYKIGMTRNSPLKRADELSSGTAIPSPFDLLFYIEVIDPAKIERVMHGQFDSVRISPNREFFYCDIRKIKEFFDIYADDGSPMSVTHSGDVEIHMADLDEKRRDHDQGDSPFWSPDISHEGNPENEVTT